MPALRVMTYNIWMGGRGGPLLHQMMRASGAEVVLVNEGPKTPFVWRKQCRELASDWAMRHVTGGRDAGSNMIVVRPGVHVKSTYTATLRQPLFQPRRGIAAAQLRVNGRLLGVVSCHLSLDAERRVIEVDRVIEAAGRLRGPVVLGGDLNELPGGPSWRRLRAAGFLDPGSEQWLTFPAEEPAKRVDALLVRGAPQVLHHGDPGVDERLQQQASDHRAVLAVLDL
jgi:endonuclease/exonuclease/phosphatase family metal-dependent hydrolase